VLCTSVQAVTFDTIAADIAKTNFMLDRAGLAAQATGHALVTDRRAGRNANTIAIRAVSPTSDNQRGGHDSLCAVFAAYASITRVE
jgi:hypothetical protein